MHAIGDGVTGESSRRMVSGLVALAALVLAAWTVVDALAVRSARRALLARYHALAAPLPEEVGARIAGQPDLGRARLILARALVASELSPEERSRRRTGDAETDLAMSLGRLATAQELAAETLRRRPVSWEAAMLLGSATYLSRSLPRDPRLVRDWPAWDRALTLSRRLAPDKDEPHRFSVLAYLELWPVLSPERRELTRSLIERGLADWRTFGYLVQLWVRIAEGPEEVFAVVPDTDFAWEWLASHYSRAGDWPSAIAARERLEGALLVELGDRLDEARQTCRAGDRGHCRRLYHGVARSARPAQRFLPLLTEVLAEAPPGPAGEVEARAFGRWLDWTLELCGVGRCPLAAAPLARLAGLAGELPPPRRALVDLLVGRLPEAERRERQTEDPTGEEWSAYWTAKAALLADAGKWPEAQVALAHVPPRPDSPWMLRTLRAHLTYPAETPAETPIGSAAWSAAGSVYRREVVSGSRPSVLEIEIAAAPGDGSVVEVAFDGLGLGWHSVRQGDTLRLALPTPREPSTQEAPAAVADWLADTGNEAHRLTFRTWAGGTARPGRVAVADAIEDASRR